MNINETVKTIVTASPANPDVATDGVLPETTSASRIKREKMAEQIKTNANSRNRDVSNEGSTPGLLSGICPLDRISRRSLLNAGRPRVAPKTTVVTARTSCSRPARSLSDPFFPL